MNNMFEEHQYQRRLLPWLLVAFIWAASIWHIYNNGLSRENLTIDISILLLLPLTITLLLFFFKLSIKIDKDYLTFKMFPFHWSYRKIKLDEIGYKNQSDFEKTPRFQENLVVFAKALFWGLVQCLFSVCSNKAPFLRRRFEQRSKNVRTNLF